MQVSWQALRVFEAAARLGSFKLASQELSITPTAVSHHISNLETRLNVELFYRQTRKVILTDNGSQLAQATCEAFRKIEHALDQVHSSGNRIKVTTTSSFAAMVLIPSLHALSIQHPHLDVSVATGESMDNHAKALPIRFGNKEQVVSEDMLKLETFNVFGTANAIAQYTRSDKVEVFSTKWKNAALPQPPFEQWLALNHLSADSFILKHYDQELFGIQEALLEDKLVFCSSTLVRKQVRSGALNAFVKHAVESQLCYYIPNKKRFDTLAQKKFICWLEEIFAAD